MNPGLTKSLRRFQCVDSRETDLSPPESFEPIENIGGSTGWYAFDRLWRLRLLVDRALGGVEIQKGRKDGAGLNSGDALDWWSVEAYQPDTLLLLRAEMKLPGRAWLRFDVSPNVTGSTIRQTTTFEAAGLAGLVYWYGTYPLHSVVFRGMLEGIVSCSKRKSDASETTRAEQSIRLS